MELIRNMPLGVGGIALALASLGNLLATYGEAVRYTCGALSAAMLVLFTLKLCLAFDNLRADLRNPVILSSMAPTTMALMLLCGYAKPFIGSLAVFLWYAVVIAHVFLILLFWQRFILKNFKLENVYPTWFIVFVCIAALSVTGSVAGATLIAQASFYLGFFPHLVIMPVIIYRMIKLGPLPEPARPTIAVFTAPTNLCVTAYFCAFEYHNPVFVYCMFALGLACYIYVTVNMVFLLRLKFYPSYSAFSFPFVISATAFRDVNMLLAGDGIYFFTPVAEISKWLAAAVVAYVLLRYAMFFFTFCKRPKGA